MSTRPTERNPNPEPLGLAEPHKPQPEGEIFQTPNLEHQHTMKYTLTLRQNLPFASNPRFVELEDERILCNNVRFPGEPDYGTRLWVVGNEYGALGAVWADCEQDALDELCDQGLSAGLMIEEQDADEETTRLGNAGEPHDLTYAWMAEVDFSDTLANFGLLMALAEARGAGVDNLAKL